MTDHSIHKDNSIKDSLAQLQDYYEAQSQLACARSFGTMPNVEKLYFLMTVVKRPTEFSVLSDIARETPYTDYRDKAQTDTKRPKQQ